MITGFRVDFGSKESIASLNLPPWVAEQVFAHPNTMDSDSNMLDGVHFTTITWKNTQYERTLTWAMSKHSIMSLFTTSMPHQSTGSSAHETLRAYPSGPESHLQTHGALGLAS